MGVLSFSERHVGSLSPVGLWHESPASRNPGDRHHRKDKFYEVPFMHLGSLQQR